MTKPRDITGQRFGKLVAIKSAYSNHKGQKVWEMLCDCGNMANVALSELVQNKTKSCGCLKSPKGDELKKKNNVKYNHRRENRLLVME